MKTAPMVRAHATRRACEDLSRAPRISAPLRSSGGSLRPKHRGRHLGARGLLRAAAGCLPVSAFLLAASSSPFADTDATHALESQIKAAFIYNFAKFVDWPTDAFDSPHTAMTICVMGGEPLAEALERAVQGNLVNGRTFAVRRAPRDDSLDPCHILVVETSETGRISRVLPKVQRRPVLTVGESGAFPSLGGIVNFFKQQNRIRFQVNVEAAERAHLKLSSKLLSVALVFHEHTSEGGK